ncbi:MAG TPA: type 1 glutamine amidotransferase [Candidatus Eisenbacteria bacterium]|nr:type 1 glutamine amidotransferase [Candidatus Eisenbacteria bacterium]
MRLHYLQHIDFEGPAAIEEYALESGLSVAGSHLYRGDALPSPSDFDVLVSMGGPMSVNDEKEFSWLVSEKRLIRVAGEAGKAVLGVCLGAQMIASAFGARVYRAQEKEIGWFPVHRVASNGVGAVFPESFTPLHWHGETFDLPPGAIRLAATEAAPNQAFHLGPRVVGLQFHMEATPRSVRMLVENAAHEIRTGHRFQQTPAEIIERTPLASAAVHPLLRALLDALIR